MPATSAATTCDGWSWFAGICTASCPPGLRAATSRPAAFLVGQPVEGGVGEDHVPAALGEVGDVALLEPETVAGQAGRPLQHGRELSRPSVSAASR